ncbi:MAG TPA: tryptophan synthase subunit alpha, partial [Anaeromyxobacter sp.]|nr:tryptophan synthase subunit alpha [Anaeromyxobacter sp.]
VLMGYLNPMIARGVERLALGCRRAGVDALIVPDLLPEDAGLLAPAVSAGLKLVFLLAPTSTPARIAAAAKAASGFLYLVSVTGVTGARSTLPEEIGGLVRAARTACSLPVVIGFGISTPEQARVLGRLADGVVVGSAVVDRIAQGGRRAVRAQRVARFVRSLKRALRP